MTNYLFVYHGGKHPETPEETDAVMSAWKTWLGALDSCTVDSGNPVGQSTTVNADGSVENHGGSNPVSGYGIFSAKSRDEAIEMARGCPILAAGGSVEIADIFNI